MTNDGETGYRARIVQPDSFTPTTRFLFAGLLIAILVGTFSGAHSLGTSRGIWDVSASLAVAACLLLALRRPAAVLVLTAAAAAALMEALDPTGPAFLATIGVVIVAARMLATPMGRGVAAFAAVAFLGTEMVTRHSLSSSGVLSEALGLFFSYTATATFGDLRREQRRTAGLLQEVLAGRDARIRAAALDERARLARELHDVLAHTLAALSIQLEGARLLVAQRSGDPAIVAILDRIARLAKDGLAEARQAVSSLRDEEPPGLERIPALAVAFEQDSSIPCTVRVEGEAPDLAPEARLALYRITQEALTNIRKHAEATMVDIVLRYSAGDVKLTISNQGQLRAAPIPGGGHGVRGMRERATLLGGDLEAGATPDGFRISVRIPR